ncbi:uncharacterized protein LOC116347766 [Contarinia nasturtii]|uniref:uncharacterized protein LOC116347766 n=1 Tax=Contarinia nasturtii TaxID=265458 RepID=UPI0012D40C78|nr:uncharacterized protein LOC116347766 [Contarinia nasturtii]
MKPLYFILFSLLLSIQLVKSQEVITFISILEALYSQKPQLTNKLNFVAAIAELTPEIEDELQPITKIEDNGWLDQLQYVKEYTDQIVAATKTIDEANQEITSLLAFEKPNEGDIEFFQEYHSFLKSTLNRSLKSGLTEMKSAFQAMHQHFDYYMSASISHKKEIVKNIVMINRTLLQLPRKTHKKIIENYIADLFKYAGQAVSEIIPYLQNLEKLKDVLENYNSARTSWVEFLIGMRHGPSSARISKGMKPRNFR